MHEFEPTLKFGDMGEAKRAWVKFLWSLSGRRGRKGQVESKGEESWRGGEASCSPSFSSSHPPFAYGVRYLLSINST
jgi:hypothetical protein